MDRKAPIQNPAVRLRVSEWAHLHRRHLRERNIEARLRDIENRVESLSTGAYPTWLTDTIRMCEVAEELRLKTEAANWMFQVAQRYSVRDREAILLAVEESLDDLEKTVESEVQFFSIPSDGELGSLCT